MQVIQITETHNITPVLSTEKSQTDKGIDHTLFTCGECATVWRSHGHSLCPTCAHHVGQHFILNQEQTCNLMDAVINLDDTTTFSNKYARNNAMCEFRDLLREHAPWYDKTSRKVIQACYEKLCGWVPPATRKIAFAIDFFKGEYANAPEEEKTFCPEVIQE